MKLKSAGYVLGIFRDSSLPPIKTKSIFDYIIELDFSSEQKFKESLDAVTHLPQIDGLMCSHENYIVFKAIAAKKLSLPSLSIDAARACTDKYEMRNRFMKYDSAITPNYIFVDSKDRLVNFAEVHGFPVILKPTNLVKSLLVTKCNDMSELIGAYENALAQLDDLYKKLHITNRKPGLILEQFIEGRMCSVAAYVDSAGEPHFCDGIVELTTAQDIGYDDNFLYTRKLLNDFDPALKTRIFETARNGVAALGMRSSPAHIEIIYNDDETKLVEIGARTGGYRPFLYEHSYEINLIEQEAKIATGQQPQVRGEFKNFSAIYELFPQAKSKFVKLENLLEKSDYAYLHQVVKPGDEVGCAKDGYKSLAIIGITDSDIKSFIQKTENIEKIKVLVV